MSIFVNTINASIILMLPVTLFYNVTFLFYDQFMRNKIYLHMYTCTIKYCTLSFIQTSIWQPFRIVNVAWLTSSHTSADSAAALRWCSATISPRHLDAKKPQCVDRLKPIIECPWSTWRQSICGRTGTVPTRPIEYRPVEDWGDR